MFARPFAAFLIFVALGTAGAQAAGDRCPVERGLRSPTSQWPTAIRFVNETGAPIRLYWIDFRGERKFYADVRPGDSLRQETFVGHVWVVTDKDENCLELAEGEEQPQAVRVQR